MKKKTGMAQFHPKIVIVCDFFKNLLIFKSKSKTKKKFYNKKLYFDFFTFIKKLGCCGVF